METYNFKKKEKNQNLDIKLEDECPVLIHYFK